MLIRVALPICLKTIDFGWVQNAELHHFADASQIAYGTVSYAKLVFENGCTHCSLLAGKSRLAHVEQMTIPRLELSTADLAVRMNQKFNTVFWLVSRAVLQYITSKETNDSTCLWPIT